MDTKRGVLAEKRLIQDLENENWGLKQKIRTLMAGKGSLSEDALAKARAQLAELQKDRSPFKTPLEETSRANISPKKRDPDASGDASRHAHAPSHSRHRSPSATPRPPSRDKLKALAKKIQAHYQKEMDDYYAEVRKDLDSLDRLKDENTQLKQQLDDQRHTANAAAADFGKEVKAFERKIDELHQQLSELETTEEALRSQLARGEKEYDQLYNQAKELHEDSQRKEQLVQELRDKVKTLELQSRQSVHQVEDENRELKAQIRALETRTQELEGTTVVLRRREQEQERTSRISSESLDAIQARAEITKLRNQILQLENENRTVRLGSELNEREVKAMKRRLNDRRASDQQILLSKTAASDELRREKLLNVQLRQEQAAAEEKVERAERAFRQANKRVQQLEAALAESAQVDLRAEMADLKAKHALELESLRREATDAHRREMKELEHRYQSIYN